MRKCKLSLRLGMAALFAASASACDLDVTNPNSPTEEQVLESPQGVIALSIGIQGQFATTIEDYVLVSALVSDEWGTKTIALLSYQSLLSGASFENTYDVVSTPYANTYQIVKSANTLLVSIPTQGFGPAFAGGMSALAKLYKAMALGNASLIYANLPANINSAGGTPVPRAQVQDSVIALLESARADIAGFSDAELAGFRTQVLPTTGFDVIAFRNTIDAMLARYALIRAQYQKAIEAASRVSPTVLPLITYPTPAVNPVQNLAFGLRYTAGLASFVTQAEPADRRPAYWLATTTPAIRGTPDSLLYEFKKYSLQNESFPLYLPDEMKLIRAEAQARLGNLAAARALINEVRTQAASAIDEPVAGLAALTDDQLPTLESILRQIAYERRYELYAQGLRWEDTRRLPSLGTLNTFTFLPLPAVECRANPNAGCGT